VAKRHPEPRTDAVVREAGERRPDDRMALAELVSRVVERGVVLSGDLVVSVGGVDLLYLGLDVLLTTMDRVEGREPEARGGEVGDSGG
jgi:hypothetical protein